MDKRAPGAGGGGSFRVAAVILAALTAFGIVGVVLRLQGGFEDRGAWGYYAATFAFLIATAGTAPIVAVGLRLTKAHWRGPVTRGAELFAVVSLLNLLWFIPLLRLMPASQGRQSIWLGWSGAPHWWDSLVLVVAVLSGLALLYLSAVPDLARPAKGLGKGRFLRRIAFAWMGTSHQWGVLRGGLLIVGAIFALSMLLLHILISADLAMSLVPGWKDSIFPVYQAVAGLQSGLAAVIVALFFLRRRAGPVGALGREQFWGLGRLLLVLTLIWFYFTWSGFFVYWYGRQPEEQVLLQFLFLGPYRLVFGLTFLFVFVAPFLLLLWNPVRRSIPGPVLAAAFVLAGTLLDKIRLYVPSFSVEGGGTLLEKLPPARLDVPDVFIMVGGIAAASLLYLLAARFLPALSLWEISEGERMQAERTFLRRRVRILAQESIATKSDAEINRELLAPVLGTPPWFWKVVGVLTGVLVAAGVAVGALLVLGLGVTGINRPVFWGFFITNFVFWVGISHAGVMISAILRLAQAEWRRPITRASEMLTVFALLAAGLFPIIHTGRPWRTLYWILPYDFPRNVWPNIRSPIMWDVVAISTYLISAILFVYVTMIPDLAALRDRTGRWWRSFYGVLSLGWRGTTRQWRLQALAGVLLSALILPIFVSVHSVVSWDFAVVGSVEGWHSTIFAPYFVIGAILSGVAAVVTVMVLMRSLFGWQSYIRLEHFDAMARLLIVVAIVWFHFFFLEFTFGLYGLEGPEIALREMVLFHAPWNILFAMFLMFAFVIPVTLWFFRRVRRSMRLMLATTLLVNVGMWLERFLIIIPGPARKQPLTFSWGTFAPSVVEITIVVGSFAGVALGLLLFAKVFPLLPLSDQKEAQVLKMDMQMGKARLTAVVRE